MVRCVKRFTQCPIEVKSIGTNKAGNDIYEICSTRGLDGLNHNDSGDAMGFSSDGNYVSFGDGVDWWAIRTNTLEKIYLGPRNANASPIAAVNTHIVWTDDSDKFWFFESGVLKLKDTSGQVYCEIPMPTTVELFDGSQGVVSYSIEACTGLSDMLVCLFDQNNNQNGWAMLDVANCTLGPAVWTVNAYQNGFNDGTVITDGMMPVANPRAIHNKECGLNGIVGGLTSDEGSTQGYYVWVPYDGSTMVSITPENVGDPNTTIHPSFDGPYMFIENRVTGLLEVYEYSSPPQQSDFSNGPVATIPNSAFIPYFVNSNPNGYQWWHGDARGDCAIYSVISPTDNTQTTFEYGIFISDTSDLPDSIGDPVCLEEGIPAELTGDFFDTSRPTKSNSGEWYAYHATNIAGQRCVRFSKVT